MLNKTIFYTSDKNFFWILPRKSSLSERIKFNLGHLVPSVLRFRRSLFQLMV